MIYREERLGILATGTLIAMGVATAANFIGKAVTRKKLLEGQRAMEVAQERISEINAEIAKLDEEINQVQAQYGDAIKKRTLTNVGIAGILAVTIFGMFN